MARLSTPSVTDSLAMNRSSVRFRQAATGGSCPETSQCPEPGHDRRLHVRSLTCGNPKHGPRPTGVCRPKSREGPRKLLVGSLEDAGWIPVRSSRGCSRNHGHPLRGYPRPAPLALATLACAGASRAAGSSRWGRFGPPCTGCRGTGQVAAYRCGPMTVMVRGRGPDASRFSKSLFRAMRCSLVDSPWTRQRPGQPGPVSGTVGRSLIAERLCVVHQRIQDFASPCR